MSATLVVDLNHARGFIMVIYVGRHDPPEGPVDVGHGSEVPSTMQAVEGDQKERLRRLQ